MEYLSDAPRGEGIAARDLSTATRVRNVVTGTVYVRTPGTDTWTAPDSRWRDVPVTTSHLETLSEMVAE